MVSAEMQKKVGKTQRKGERGKTVEKRLKGRERERVRGSQRQGSESARRERNVRGERAGQWWRVQIGRQTARGS